MTFDIQLSMGLQTLLVLAPILSVVVTAQLQSSSGYNPPDTVCAGTEFYCNYTKQCTPRRVRCLLESERTSVSCLNPKTHEEDGCRGDFTEGVFEIWEGWSTLSKFLSSKASDGRPHRFEHQFIEYRGFTYEYGPDGVSVRDINDPNFMYKTRKFYDFEKVGVSRCKMSNLQDFLDDWVETPYAVWSHNCQHFVAKLTEILEGNCVPLASKLYHMANVDQGKRLSQTLDGDDDEKTESGSSVRGSGIIDSRSDVRKIEARTEVYYDGVLIDGSWTHVEETKSEVQISAVWLTLAVIAVVLLTVGGVVVYVVFVKKKRTAETRALLGKSTA